MRAFVLTIFIIQCVAFVASLFNAAPADTVSKRIGYVLHALTNMGVGMWAAYLLWIV